MLNLIQQVIRNISMWTFRSQERMENPDKEYRERTLWDPLVEPLLDLATETESHELLVEVCNHASLVVRICRVSWQGAAVSRV